MALGLKYFARYKDINNTIKELRFLNEGYAGVAIEWFCHSGAVIWDYADSDEMFSDPIIPSTAKINLHLDDHYDLSEFVFNRKTFFVELWNTADNIIEWSGWVEPWNAQRTHKRLPWQVTLTASCGLAHLNRKKYLNTTNIFKKTGLDIIRECLNTIGATQNILVSTHMVETSFGGSALQGLSSFELNTARYYDSNGEAMYCDLIINDILNHFNAVIFQADNRWVIWSIVDNATGFTSDFIEIGSNSGAHWPTTYIVNADGAATVDGGSVSILAPKNKYRVEVDFGEQMPFFPNGNMVLWTEDGLVGWDFSTMPKGVPGWERFEVGVEGESRGVLKINGYTPGPHRKKVKKKFGQLLVSALVGIFGKRKDEYYYIHPARVWLFSDIKRSKLRVR